jgi:hypothetical protein
MLSATLITFVMAAGMLTARMVFTVMMAAGCIRDLL